MEDFFSESKNLYAKMFPHVKQDQPDNDLFMVGRFNQTNAYRNERKAGREGEKND